MHSDSQDKDSHRQGLFTEHVLGAGLVLTGRLHLASSSQGPR